MSWPRVLAGAALVLVASTLLAGSAAALVNGGFESGLVGWTRYGRPSFVETTDSGGGAWGSYVRETGAPFAASGSQGLHQRCTESGLAYDDPVYGRPYWFCHVGVEQSHPAPAGIGLWFQLKRATGYYGADLVVEAIDSSGSFRYVFTNAPASWAHDGSAGHSRFESLPLDAWHFRCLDAPSDYAAAHGRAMAGPMLVRLVTYADETAAETWVDSVAATPCNPQAPPEWDPGTPCGAHGVVAPGTMVETDVRAVGPPVRVIAITHSSLPAGATFGGGANPGNPANGTFRWVPTASDFGVHSVTFTAMDDLGQSAPPCVLTIEVRTEPGWTRAPCGATIVDDAGASIGFHVEAASADTARLVLVTHTPLPGSSTFGGGVNPGNPADGTFAWSTTAADVGTHDLVFSAEDDLGARAPDCPVRLVVTAPPEWVAPTRCGATYDVDAGTTVSFEVRAASADPARALAIVAVAKPATASFGGGTNPGNPANGYFSWTPTAADVGSHTAGFETTDDLGRAAPPCAMTLRVHVPPEWDPRAPCSSTFVVDAGALVEFDVRAASPDPARSVTILALGKPAGATFSGGTNPGNPANDTFRWVPTSADVGIHDVVFRAEDDRGVRAPDCPARIHVTAPPEWVAPSACGAWHAAHAGATITFEVRAASADPSRSVTISVLAKPAAATFGGGTNPGNPAHGFFSWTPVAADAGPHVVRFGAKDDLGRAAPECAHVIYVHAPPEWDAATPCFGSHLVYAGDTIEFDVKASSPDPARIVTLYAFGLPAGATFGGGINPGNPANGTFRWTPTAADVGTHVVVFQAVDDWNQTSSQCPVRIDVTAPPEWDAPCGGTKTVAPGSSVTFDVRSLSADPARILTIGHSALPGSATVTAVANPGNPAEVRFDWTPTVFDVGTHTVTFTATDDLGRSAPPCPITIEVTFVPPGALTWGAGTPCGDRLGRAVGHAFHFEVSASHTSPVQLVRLSHGPLPGAATFTPTTPPWSNPAKGDFDWTPTAHDAGTYVVTFYAEDLDGNLIACDVELDVQDNRPPIWASSTPCGTLLTARAGTPIVFAIGAENPMPHRLVRLDWGPLPPGAGITRTSAEWSNPATASFAWTPLPAHAGIWSIPLYAADDYGESAPRCEVRIRVT